MFLKRAHGDTPIADRRPTKVLREIQPNSPRVILDGVMKDDNPVMNCSFENSTAVSKETKKKISKLVELMDGLKKEIPVLEEFIENCDKRFDDYTDIAKQFSQEAVRAIQLQDEPFVMKNIEPSVPIIAKDILDNFVKNKMKVNNKNVELEEQLIVMKQKYEKATVSNNNLQLEIHQKLEECEKQIQEYDNILLMLHCL